MLRNKCTLVCLGILGFVFSLTGCGGSSPAVSVAVTASATTVDGADTATMTAKVTNDHNAAGVTWSVSGPGTLSAETTSSATYTAPAATNASQSATITATSIADNAKTGTTTITIPAAPAVTSTSASLAGSVGTAYSVQLLASGGIAPYTWALGTGATLPACLTLKSSGVITTTSGLPPTATCAGTYSNLTFKVTDSGTPTALSATSSSLSITITAPSITFIATLPAGTVGSAYSGSVTAPGALGTTTYSLASGALPASGDLVLNPNTGAITGTPKAADAGTYNFTVGVTDQYGDTATSSPLSITITAPTITFPASLPGANVGTAYNGSVAATGPVGTTTYVLASGALPASGDLVLNAGTGAITGTPKAADAGTFTFTVKVTDQYGDTATSGALSIKITAPTITFPASLPGANVGTAYNGSVAATGPVGTTTYVLASGALPASGDLLLNAGTGAITGTPKAADVGSYPLTVKVTDQYGDTATSGTLTIVVNAAPAITFGAAPAASATAGVTYSSTLSASGGAGSLTYSIVGGALPTGLTLAAGTGAITGTPTGAATTYHFTAQASDNFGDTPATQDYAITLNPGSATHFVVVVTSATTITAGGTASFSVTAQDAYGNKATGYAGMVEFTSSDSKAVLPGPAALPAGAGNFTATLETAGNQTITATDTVIATITGTSGSITVNPGAAAKFLVTAPSAATTTVAFGFTVTAQDSYNNTATAYAGTVHFTSTDSAATLPANSSLTNGTGSFQATLKTNGAQSITATDTVSGITGTSGNITVSSALIISTASLNPLDVDQAPTQVLAASGGSGIPSDYSWTWTAQAGSSIPPGLSLSTGGAIQGSPTTAGTYQVAVKVADSGTSTNYSANFSMTIYAALSLPAPDPESLPSTAYAGYVYNSGAGGSITGSGGSGNTNLSISAIGLPSDGLSGAPTGATLTVTGTPATAATVTFGAKLTDSSTGYSITQTGYNITVSTPVAVSLPAPSSSIPGSATVGQSYNGSITASNGVPPYIWSINGTTVTSGGLSIGDGLTATSTGGGTLTFSGTPTTAQAITLTNVKVVDSETPTTNAANTYTIQVNSAGGQISGQINLMNVCNVSTLPTFTVTLNTSPATQVQTNSSGQFTFNNVPAGTYTITPSIPGATSSLFYPASYTGVVVTNGTNLSSENFNVNVGYTVSGTVSYGGSQTGQTYVYLENNSCGGQGNPGTSITQATLTSSGSYSIRGVPPGGYTLYAWMDSTGVASGTDYPGPQGAQNANNPTGSSSAVSVTSANVTAANVTLQNPTYATPPNNPSFEVIPSGGGWLLFYSPPTVSSSNGNNQEAANEYVVQWATPTGTDTDGNQTCALGGGTGGAEFGAVAGSHTFYAIGNGSTVWILNNTSMGAGTFSGGAYCFQARSINTLASTTHPSGWADFTDSSGSPEAITPGTSGTFCTSNCTTVSGAVTIPSGVTIAAGAPLYVGYFQQSSSGKGPSAIYATEVASPVSGGSGNSYQLTVPSGSGYVLFGILDQNNDGAIDAGDVTNVRNNNSNGVTFSGGSLTNQDLTLPSANSTVQVQTQYSASNCSGCTASYALNLQLNEGNKLPVAVTLSGTSVAAPYLMMPVDISLCASCGNNIQYDYYATLPGGTPSVGDSFDFTVTYSDGTQDTGTAVNGAITAFGSTGAVAGASDVATNLQTAGTNPLEPNFTWTFPANPTDYTYQFYLSQSGACIGNCTIWQIPGQNSNSNGFTYGQTEIGATTGQITWGTDPTGGGSTPSGSLNASGDYYWQFTVQDNNGNQAQSSANDNNP
jgi:Putative Ig domain